MLRNFSSKPRNIKLEKQPGMPTIKLLEEMRQKSIANAGALIELPFGEESEMLILTVNRDAVKGSWLWMLYVDDGFGSKMDWSYVTHDVSYIHALIANAHPGFLLKTHAQPTSTSPVAQEQVVKGTIEGNLKDMQVTTLLQSVSMERMTGRLEIISTDDRANVMFVNGQPVHCTMRGASGTEAIVQLFTWTEGKFSFFNESVTVEQTITRAMTGLIMEGITFDDHYRFLKNRGLTHQCIPVRLKNISSAQDLAALVENIVDCNRELQWKIYNQFNGKNWAEIVRDLAAQKTEWVPALFNLVSGDIVKFDTASVSVDQPKITTVDWSIAETVRNGLSRSDTGIYTYASLLYNLELEYSRYEGFELPFSLIVFGYCLNTNEILQDLKFIPLKHGAVSELRDRVQQITKKYDFLCHYGAFAFAILLPMTVSRSAIQFANILADTCGGINVTNDYDKESVDFCAGIANVPDDCQTLDEILNKAEKVRRLSG